MATQTNLWVRETYLNETKNTVYGNSGWYETFTDSTGTLFRALRREYGKPQKMYVDNGQQVGWVFSRTDRYEGTREPYRREVWVEVSTTQPEQATSERNITWPWASKSRPKQSNN